MARYLESGTRRDCCVLLHVAGELRGQELKARLEDHYDERLRPGLFYDQLDALVSAGHVERRTEGVHDVYALTDAGKRALEAHVAWLNERVADRGENGNGDGGNGDGDGSEGGDADDRP